MSEQIEACACGYIIPYFRGTPGAYCQIFCPKCRRTGKVEDSRDAIVAAWNADMRAIKAARDAKSEPETPKNKVYAGKWHAVAERIYASDGGAKNDLIVTIPRPDDIRPADGVTIAKSTAKLMAASKEMHRKLAQGRALYRDGYSSTSLSEFFCSVGAFLDGLEVDVD